MLGRIEWAACGGSRVTLSVLVWLLWASFVSSFAQSPVSGDHPPLTDILSKLESNETSDAERLIEENQPKVKEQLEAVLETIDRDFDALGLYGATSYKLGPGYQPLAESSRRYQRVFELYGRRSGDDAPYKKLEARRLRIEGADLTNRGEIVCGEKLDWGAAQPLYQMAMERLEAAFDLASELNDFRVMASAKNNMGSTLSRLGKPDEAIKAYSEGLQYAEKLPDDLYKGLLRLNLGNAYAWIGKPEEALTYLRPALDIFKRMDQRTWEANVLMTIGNAYLREQKFADSWENLNLALEMAKQSGENRVRGRALLNLGMAGLQLQKKEAIPVLEEALQWYDQDAGKEVYVPIEREFVRQDGLRLLSQVARELGDDALARKYTSQFFESIGPNRDRYQTLRQSPCFEIYRARPQAVKPMIPIPVPGK